MKYFQIMNIENILGSNYVSIIRFVSLYNNKQEHFCDLEFDYLYNSNLTVDENEKINLIVSSKTDSLFN